MDLKTLLKGGGMVVPAIVAALYICGWQQYLALFHALGLDIHFFIPIQIGLGAGVEPVMTLLVVPSGTAALAGLIAARVDRKWKYILLVLSLVSGLVLPVFAKRVAGAWMQISFSWSQWLELSMLGFCLAYSLFTLVFSYEGGLHPRYRWYALSVVFLLSASALYGNVRGRSVAFANSAEKLAVLTLEDKELQDLYAQQLFAPLLEIDDYMIFVRFGPNDLDPPSLGSATSVTRQAHKLSQGKILFVKKSIIRTVEFKK